MKPRSQKPQGKLQGKPHGKPNKGPGKVAHSQKPYFKNKNKQKGKDDKPNKPEIRNMKRQEKAAKEAAEREKVRAERDAQVKAYKKKRLEKTKAISKRTQKGQPLMKDRMQLLLKQIEEMKRH
ncbi:thyroid transcription factor 1-associated protein 26 [Drosophila subpulchrella]|uniref:thyroid transcription factor 1-associated protein 26 n=1 Tax=Drosophila subpulchrella TaxID=1486046 RepID=UPI0018A19D2D|nr:thyroid transcription factor 1-associated protein 26 [Drosophila subpulchrella]